MARHEAVTGWRVARRLERPAWVNGRTILGVALFAVSFLAAQRVMAQQSSTVSVWAATGDLAEGSTLGEGDLRAVPVHLPSELMASYVVSSRNIAGASITRSIAGGELVPVSWLARGAASGAERTVTIPVDEDHAVGGLLRVGDRVDVLATFDERDGRARTLVLIHDAEVADLLETSGALLDGETTRGVTVSISASDAARLVFALRTAAIDVIRVDRPGATSDAEVVEEDLR